MRPSRTLPRIVVLAALAACSGRAEAASYRGVTGIAPGHVAWIYRQPDTAAPHVGYLRHRDLRVQTIACKRLAAGGWCHVVHAGVRGWVQDRFLRATAVMRG